MIPSTAPSRRRTPRTAPASTTAVTTPSPTAVAVALGRSAAYIDIPHDPRRNHGGRLRTAAATEAACDGATVTTASPPPEPSRIRARFPSEPFETCSTMVGRSNATPATRAPTPQRHQRSRSLDPDGVRARPTTTPESRTTAASAETATNDRWVWAATAAAAIPIGAAGRHPCHTPHAPISPASSARVATWGFQGSTSTCEPIDHAKPALHARIPAANAGRAARLATTATAAMARQLRAATPSAIPEDPSTFTKGAVNHRTAGPGWL